MTETTLRTLWTRKMAGEKVAALAAEAGLSDYRTLVNAWKKAGYFCKPAEAPAQEPAVTPTEGTVEQATATVPAPVQPEPTPAPETKPAAKKETPVFDLEL